MQVGQAVFSCFKSPDVIVGIKGKMVFQDLAIPWIILNYKYAIVFHTVDFFQNILISIPFQAFLINSHSGKSYRLLVYQLNT